MSLAAPAPAPASAPAPAPAPMAAPARRPRVGLPVPALLAAVSVALFLGTALATGQRSAMSFEGVVGLLQRMIALGFVALGQTFTILVGSIDLSVANLVSLVAVLASYVMGGDPAMIVPAVGLAILAALLVGVLNGLLVAKAGINPLIATLGTGLMLQGVLSASYEHLRGSVPPAFQGLAYGSAGGVPYALLGLLLAAFAAYALLRFTRLGAHLYAVGGNPAGARMAGIATERVTILAHLAASLGAALTGLYLAARLSSGTPWIGRDGAYDLESIAVVVIGGTLLSGGRGGVWGTLAGVFFFASLDACFTMAGVDAFLKQVLRGAIVVAAVAVYTIRTKGHVA